MLIIATCFYLASKTEESPVHIKTVVNEMKNLFSTNFPFDSSHISEFEFYLLEAMQFYTIVYHPYNTLTALINALDLDKKQSMIVLQTSRFKFLTQFYCK
jgi:cyclin C